MSADYRSVLSSIVHLSRQQKEGDKISLTYLAEQLSCTVHELEDAVRLVEQEGYVSIAHPTPRVTVLHPTIRGYEKVQEWEEKAQAKVPGRRFFTLGKIIGTSLFAVLLGIVWWYLGINTSQIEPLRVQMVPFKIYNQYTDTQGRFYYDVLNTARQTGEIGNPDGSITATLDGKIVIGFDVESTAENHQVNVQSIDVELVREDVSEVLDLDSIIHGQGGGVPQDYEVRLDPALSLAAGKPVIVHAEIVMPSNVEYVYLRPGEREVFRMYLTLPEPGRYQLTPIINYTFQDKSSTQRTGTTPVYYPRRFRYAIKNYDNSSNTATYTPGQVILDTQSKSFSIPESFGYQSQSCVDLNKWIAFVAWLSWGNDARLFILNPMTGMLDMLTDHIRDIDILGWDYSNTLYFSESFLDYRTYTTSTEIKSWNPDQGTRGFTLKDLPQDLYNPAKYNNECREPGLCLESTQQDTNGDGIINYEDVDQIVLFDSINNKMVRLGFSNQDQSGPAYSPDKNKILYIEGSRCEGEYGDHIMVLDVNTRDLQQVTISQGTIRSTVWSPDGQRIAYASTSCKDGFSQIHIVDLVGLTDLAITSETSQDTVFGWSSDSNWLLIGGDQIALVSRNGVCVQPILPSVSVEKDVEDPFVQGVIQP
jgi:hypothetical protein